MQHTEFNSLSFILNAGPVAILVAAFLLIMSVASWYFIVVKVVQAKRLKNITQQYVTNFWSAPNLQAALKIDAPSSPASRLAHQSMEASTHYQTHVSSNLESGCSYDEFIARSMRRNIAETSASLESGLSVLASVGSIAPFVGLFGTVWGIYHALAAISASGQASLDKVAGPVGEALIMTAIGLAVAIPAVLAYNAFIKSNRHVIYQLDCFAQDLHTLLTTGAVLAVKKSNAKQQVVSDISAAQHIKNSGVAAW